MDKVYNPHAIEQKWYTSWEQSGAFSPNLDKTASPYCIVIPPPNVTGSLHMGHAFQDTLMDTLTRFHRMRGHPTLWQVGTDHAGIATQMVVERQLQAQHNLSRHDLGREAFVEKIWEWKKTSGDTISQQLRRLGGSVDWNTERFTLDEGLSQAVQKVFIQLYREGLIYRGKRLVNWDPILHTAVSDLEVISEEENGHLWHIRYPIVDSNDTLTIATTRPETLLGDVAVAVSPKDERYQHLIGQSIILPITQRIVPIIADDYVDPEFGTGCVKITPAHDFNDYEIGKRHQLEPINIFNPDATLNDQVPEAYRVMDRFDARKKLLEELETLGLLEKTEPHVLKVPRGDRTHTIIEPLLTDQWFVKIEDLAKPAIAAVDRGDIEFIPANWKKTYDEWMRNIQDWCISRQLWWGHRIPAWYDEAGNIYVGESKADIIESYQLPADIALTQDPDVLDTWFSSALWPFSSLGWPNEKDTAFKDFYPTSVLVTGFDIIFFWVARMIMFGLKFTGKIPFEKVYIHGLIQDQNGQKMSKSKGNVIDPLDLISGIDLEALVTKRTSGLMQPAMKKSIEKHTRKEFPEGIPAYGTDALRFTFCALATQGRHLRFELNRVESSRNFCNKIWNAARYVLMTVQTVPVTTLQTQATQEPIHPVNQWITSIWQNTKETVIEHMSQYRFDFVAEDLYQFTWDHYCDWYLELSKPLLKNKDNPELLQETQYTLVHILGELLHVLHPIMPFLTEEIWERLNPLLSTQTSLLLESDFPEPNANRRYPAAEQTVAGIQSFITAVRTLRSEMNIAPSRALSLYVSKGTEIEQEWLTEQADLIATLAKIETFRLEPVPSNEATANAFVGELEIALPLKGVIDTTAELTRLEREIKKIQKEVDRASGKLANPNYRAKAPKAVVQKEEAGLKDYQQTLKKLQAHYQTLRDMDAA